MALALNVEQLIIRGDSKVVLDHVTGSFKAKEDNMKNYYSALIKSSRPPGSRKLTEKTMER